MPRTMLPIILVAGIALVPLFCRAQEGFSWQSVKINQATSDVTFPAAPGSDATNNNCLICHSAGMVLTQPAMSKADWRAEVEKMRTTFKAPIDPKDVDAIVDYLVSIRGWDTAAPDKQISARQADPNRGAVIAAQGSPGGAPACARCHAFNGGSDGSGAFPRIAGLPTYYFVMQLRELGSGVRENGIMSPIA